MPLWLLVPVGLLGAFRQIIFLFQECCLYACGLYLAGEALDFVCMFLKIFRNRERHNKPMGGFAHSSQTMAEHIWPPAFCDFHSLSKYNKKHFESKDWGEVLAVAAGSNGHRTTLFKSDSYTYPGSTQEKRNLILHTKLLFSYLRRLFESTSGSFSPRIKINIKRLPSLWRVGACGKTAQLTDTRLENFLFMQCW